MEDIYFDGIYEEKDTKKLVYLTYGSFMIKIKSDHDKWEDAVVYKRDEGAQTYAMTIAQFKKHFELVARASEVNNG